MLLIRNLVYWTCMVLLALLMCVPFLLVSILPARKRHCFGVFWAKANVWMLAFFIGVKYRVVGRENMPTEPSIICCKHQSGWETYALQAIFPHQVFVCKKSLFWVPILGQFLMIMSPIAIDRNKPKEASKRIIEQGKKRKEKGFWISIFPEGTRVRPGEQVKYKLGAARMAKQLEMNIVPVACNSGRLWPKNSFMKYPGMITVSIGPIIDYQLGEPDFLMAQCEQWIEMQQKIIDVPEMVSSN